MFFAQKAEEQRAAGSGHFACSTVGPSSGRGARTGESVFHLKGLIVQAEET